MIDHREYKERTQATDRAKQRAIELRKQLTDPEKMLWAILKGNKLGGHACRTQHAIGPYIADFYCHAARFVIEIDGKTHKDEQLHHDAARDAWMQSCGIEVLRVSAADVFSNLKGVHQTIADRVARRIALINQST